MSGNSGITLIAICIVLEIIFVAPFYAEGSMKEADDNKGIVSAEEVPTQTPQKTKHDPFSIAIIGISLGCMLVASSVHWNSTQRKQIETKIMELDNFLAKNCAVELHINSNNDNEPMVNSVKDIQEKRDFKIQEYEEHKNLILRRVSDVEAEIMKIWG